MRRHFFRDSISAGASFGVCGGAMRSSSSRRRASSTNLDSDAEETRNLVGENASLALELRSRLEGMRGTSEVRAGAVDERTLASLRALGYLGGSSTTPTEGPLADPKDRVAIYNEILELSVVAAPTAEDVKRIEAVLVQEPRNPRALFDLRRFSPFERATGRCGVCLP